MPRRRLGAHRFGREARRDTRAATRETHRRVGRSWVTPQSIEGEPSPSHEGRGSAPVTPDLRAGSRGQDGAAIVHDRENRHPRPAVEVGEDLDFDEAEVYGRGRSEREWDSGGKRSAKGRSEE